MPNIEVLRPTRHHKKLRRGGLAANRFGFGYATSMHRAQGLEDRLAQDAGYRRAQLFWGAALWPGRQTTSRPPTACSRAARWFATVTSGGCIFRRRGRLLFNHVLSERVGAGSWNRVIDGDVMMLDGTHSIFPAEPGDTALESRLRRFDIHPTGPCGAAVRRPPALRRWTWRTARAFASMRFCSVVSRASGSSMSAGPCV